MPNTQNTVIDTVTFDKTQLCIIDHNKEPWVTSTDLALALGYEDKKSASRIYNRNKDEFSVDMATEVKLTSVDNKMRNKLIFSPRGCHLIAMFARTEKAKLFRKWVLDVLENYQFGDGHGAPVYEDYQSHTISGHEPVIVPLEFNGQMVPFTFDGGKLWLNCHNLGLILKPQSPSPGKAIYNLWLRLKNDLPEDGCRLVTWSKVGRTSGERVFDLETCKEIAFWSGYDDHRIAAALWLRELEESAVSNNANKLLPADNIIKARALNNLLLERETGDAVHIHELINQFLMQ